VTNIPFVFQGRVRFLRQGYFNKMVVIVGADDTMVGVMMGDEAAG
jgi:hypothetical protein